MALAIVCVGLGFGDEGKGATVSYLTEKHKAALVVRTGGHQAAHNVYSPSGGRHTFSQFGSGTFHGARTFLSERMMVSPYGLAAEAKHLNLYLGVANPLSLIDVSKLAMVTTPFHMASNRLKEMARGGGRHGSCGVGIGETARLSCGEDSDTLLLMSDLQGPPSILQHKLRSIQDKLLTDTYDARLTLEGSDLPQVKEEVSILTDYYLVDKVAEDFRGIADKLNLFDDAKYLKRMLKDGTTIFESSQGILLDEFHGFFPHVTRVGTTNFEAKCLIEDSVGANKIETKVLGITRSYTTRHGAGPFVTEDLTLDLPEPHNGYGFYTDNFRAGYLDLPALRYSLKAADNRNSLSDKGSAIDGLVVNHMDRVLSKVCTSYDSGEIPFSDLTLDSLSVRTKVTEGLSKVTPKYTHVSKEEFLPFLETTLGVPVVLTANGPRNSDRTCLKGDI